MARVGQSLSSSRTTIDISPDSIKLISDIVSTTSNSVHTDGVGLVSAALAADITEAMGQSKSNLKPVCWQVSSEWFRWEPG